MKLTAVTLLARAGLLHLLPGRVTVGGPGTFIDDLHSLLDVEFAAASVQLGPPRINRKPVLRLMDRSGRAIAFVKLGVTPLTCERVRAETDALRRLEAVETPGLRTPSVLAAGTWRGFDYLVLSPLDTTTEGASAAARRRASTALVEAFEVERPPLASATWWRTTWARLEGCDAELPEVGRLLRAGRELIERYGDMPVPSGACHGDWSPWNICARHDGVLAWDWERFSTSRPVGWDEIHYRLSAGAKGIVAALQRVHRETVAEHGRGSRQEVIYASYLMQRGITFVADDHQRAGSPNGPLAEWLLPALEAVVPPTGTA